MASCPPKEMFTGGNPELSSTEEISRQYDSLYEEGWLHSRTAVLSWVLHFVVARPSASLLDVACGNGQMAAMVKARGLRFFGLDLSFSALRMAARGKMLAGDGMYLPFPRETFDVVTNIGSLEHYIHPETGVREMARVLKPGGRAYILVPNAFGLTWNVLRVWRTGGLADDDGQPIQRFGTRRAWQQLLVDNGLLVEKVVGYERSLPRNKADWLQYVKQPQELLLAMLTPFLPVNAKRMFLFICLKKPVT